MTVGEGVLDNILRIGDRAQHAVGDAHDRLCPDQLKSARRRREVYPGIWLPEPVVEAEVNEVDDVPLPLVMALERLSPLECAAFILHDVFGIGFDAISSDGGHQ